jgi:sigma-B regulation protein RsbU (phosphoserine phosphatase)
VTDTPILRLDGSVGAIIGVSEDVTELRRNAAMLQFAQDITNALTQSFELGEQLERLARVSVPRLADGSAVYLLDGEHAAKLVALHHRDPEYEKRLRDHLERHGVRLEAATGTGAALREGATSWLPRIDDDVLAGIARDADHLAELRSLAVTSSLSVPLKGRAGTIGAIAFFTGGERRLSEDDVRLAEEVCARAGILVENAKLYDARQRDAEAQRYHAALLGALFEASPDGVLVVDQDARVLSYNRRFVDMWGFEDDLVARSDDDALLDSAMGKVADPRAFIGRVRSVYSGPRAPARDELRLADGRIFDRHGVPLYGEDGGFYGWAWSFRDITTAHEQQAQVMAAGERFAALARTLQQSLLPPSLPSPERIEFAGRYHPAMEGTEIGGDFYDVFAVEGDWVLVIGDVCGKGPAAAALTALIRYTIRAVAMHTHDPAGVLTELNTVMLAEAASGSGPAADDRFATVCCLWLSPRPEGYVTVKVACGGHPLPLMLRADGTVEAVGAPGTLIGVLADVDITSTSLRLVPGEGIVVVTDGVLEARDGGGLQLDEAGLVELLDRVKDRSPAEITQAVERHALERQGGVARDDIAVLVARVQPVT